MVPIDKIPDILDSFDSNQVLLLKRIMQETIKAESHPDSYKRKVIEQEKLPDTEITYGEVFKSMTTDQRFVLYFVDTFITIKIRNGESDLGLEKYMNSKENNNFKGDN